MAQGIARGNQVVGVGDIYDRSNHPQADAAVVLMPIGEY